MPLNQDARPDVMEPSPCSDDPDTIGVVVVHWDQPDRFRKTIDSFAAQTVPIEMVVVDNGSREQVLAELESVALASSLFVKIIRLGENRGFGPAANVGLRYWLERSAHELLVVAPHDALPAVDCLQKMADHFRDQPGIGLACADVGDGVTPYVNPYLGGVALPARVDEGWEPADFVHGTLFMGRRVCLEEIGLFDERFFAYGEEVEIGIRARNARWRVGLVRGACVINPTMRIGSQAVDYLMQRNTLLIVREASGRTHAMTRLAIAVVGLVRGFLPSSSPFLFAPYARMRGFVDYLRGSFGPPPREFFEELDAKGEPRDRAPVRKRPDTVLG